MQTRLAAAELDAARARRPAEAPRAAVLRSGLLPEIYERLRTRPGARVLDLGPPSPAKLAFFGTLRCRLHCNNFPESLSGRLRDAEGAASVPHFQLEDLLIAPSGGDFDVILAWDYFDYMRLEAVRHLVAGLRSYCRDQTWLYFLIAQGSRIPETPAAIEPEDAQHLRYDAGAAVRPATRCPPKVLEGLMPGFHIHKLYLLKNGVQEHLFVFRP